MGSHRPNPLDSGLCLKETKFLRDLFLWSFCEPLPRTRPKFGIFLDPLSYSAVGLAPGTEASTASMLRSWCAVNLSLTRGVRMMRDFPSCLEWQAAGWSPNSESKHMAGRKDAVAVGEVTQ